MGGYYGNSQSDLSAILMEHRKNIEREEKPSDELELTLWEG
jgi:hypothetical protein